MRVACDKRSLVRLEMMKTQRNGLRKFRAHRGELLAGNMGSDRTVVLYRLTLNKAEFGL